MPPTIVRLRRINGPQNQALSWLCRQHLRRSANGKIAGFCRRIKKLYVTTGWGGFGRNLRPMIMPALSSQIP
jgi:hypothetical protein